MWKMVSRIAFQQLTEKITVGEMVTKRRRAALLRTTMPKTMRVLLAPMALMTVMSQILAETPLPDETSKLAKFAKSPKPTPPHWGGAFFLKEQC